MSKYRHDDLQPLQGENVGDKHAKALPEDEWKRVKIVTKQL